MGQKAAMVSLTLNKEFKRAYFQGKFKAHPVLVTYLVKNRLRSSRFGITTSKKVGGAVQRNRARRMIKQAYREILLEGTFSLTGFDLVFVARAPILECKTFDVKRVMKKQISVLLERKA